jgi:hypothetical protein
LEGKWAFEWGFLMVWLKGTGMELPLVNQLVEQMVVLRELLMAMEKGSEMEQG